MVFYDMFLAIIKELLSYSSIYLGIAGLFIAWQGLTTWKRQLKGNAEYDIARKILYLAYKVRRGVEIVRNPFMSVYEMLDFDFPANLSEKEKEKFGIRKAFEKRFQLLNSTRDQLLVDILEGEVLWGKEIRKITYEYLRTVVKLDLAVTDHLKAQTEEGRMQFGKEYWDKRQGEVDDIIYDLSPNSIDIHPDDKFAVELNEKIEAIENYLKKYLHRK